jgi:hypothetical protein
MHTLVRLSSGDYSPYCRRPIIPGRFVSIAAYGNKLYHKQQYLITDNKIVPVDVDGKRHYNMPALVINGR